MKKTKDDEVSLVSDEELVGVTGGGPRVQDERPFAGLNDKTPVPIAELHKENPIPND